MPTEWKPHAITPVFKSGDKSNVNKLDILISKYQALQKSPWTETHKNLIPTKLNNDTVQFHCYITIVNKNIPHN